MREVAKHEGSVTIAQGIAEGECDSYHLEDLATSQFMHNSIDAQLKA